MAVEATKMKNSEVRSVLEAEAPPTVSANALKVLERRYLAKAHDGKTILETPKDLFVRVAANLAEAEKRYNASATQEAAVAKDFYQLMSTFKFLPNSPTLMNAGRELQQLSACFVLPVDDSVPAIFESVKQQAIIHKTGGGTGFSFSRIRPKSDIVKSTSGIASGPLSFMKIFNTATEQVKQGGTRRGANMAILRVDHPDIMDFIDMKMTRSTTEVLTDGGWLPKPQAAAQGFEWSDERVIPGEMENFNVSVALTNDFMDAWKKGADYNLLNPRTKEVVGTMNSRAIMDKIAHNAWISGEPGLFFIDRANETNPVPHISEIEATNPCGEQDLMPYDSCNLGSLVLDNHMREVAPGKFEMDWDSLRASIRTSVHLLDNVIDMNAYPLKEIQEMSQGTRRIGLGLMGFARMLFKLEIPYDSEAGLDMARQVMGFIKEEGIKASEELAETRGPYGFWEGSVHQKQGLKPRRNAYVTTIAPTGTISMISDTSGGCEPEFSLIWYKNVMDGTHLPYVLDYFEEVAAREGFAYDGLMDDVLKNGGSPRGLEKVPTKWQQVFGTSMDVSAEWHVKMQGAFQGCVDAAVSKTINMPKKATEEDVKNAYLLAWDLGCKGITVYRDGSREDQVLNLGTSAKLDPKAAKAQQQKIIQGAMPAGKAVLKPRPRPDVIVGTTQKIETGYGSLYVTINEDEHGIFEVFATLGKSGGYTSSFTEALARLTSLCLRSGIPAEELIKQIDGIRSPKIAYDHREKILSVPDGIAKAVRRQLRGDLDKSIQARLDSIGLVRQLNEDVEEAVEVDSEVDREVGDAEERMNELIERGDNPECPDCSNVLTLAEGCVKCLGCGYSEC